MATPMVSGSAAILWAAAAGAGKAVSWADVKDALLSSTDPQLVPLTGQE